ncbi:hypothetical protein SAMN03159341_12125 [Paenibacillus sp. 1_12]|uniref:hypothetical protein n=1 Tax=Paenibacillus sp. 1_12 TaxID=1566278 RepID=UPI0008E2844A|nr:hypothetical protein [Paenibacillus sp. 1_12]SFM22183.1 hypothetical protein SAMN03159341_12125 [Paenibacillus sp. 1_12]
MSNFNSSITSSLKWLGVLVFDIAVIVVFLKIFSGLFILAPVKLALMSMVLLLGLFFFSASVVFPRLLSGSKSIAYPIATIFVSIMYLVLSNLISVFFIEGGMVWYIGWELLAFASLLGVLSVLFFFSKRETEYENQVELEQSEKTNIHMQLMFIETSLTAKQNVEGIVPIMHSFKLLKERIHASTPFGRITGNSAVFELENTIRSNLDYLQLYIRSNSLDKNMVDIHNLIDETRTLMANRELLNVR